MPERLKRDDGRAGRRRRRAGYAFMALAAGLTVAALAAQLTEQESRPRPAVAPAAQAAEKEAGPNPDPTGDRLFDKAPVVLKRVDPAYPDSARKAGIEGAVQVKIRIDAEGMVREAAALKSTQAGFVKPALEAVRQWIFEPALLDGRPVSVWIVVPFAFRLK